MVQIKGLAVEGLDRSSDHDLSNVSDTPPNAINIWFDTDSVYMAPVVSDAGELVREERWETFVYFNFEYDMGFCAGRQRLKDKVRLNEQTGKWEIIKLAPGEMSHIRRYPEQWNAFYEGLNFNEIGTPLDVLFPQDKSRIKHLNKLGIFTVERLAAISEGEASLGGMGVLDNKRRAESYLARMKESSHARETESYVKALETHKTQSDQKILELQEMVARLMADKETEDIPATKKRAKKSEVQAEA